MTWLNILLLLLLWGCTTKSTQEQQSQLCRHLTAMDEATLKLRRIQISADAALAAWNQPDWQQANQESDQAFAAIKATATPNANIDDLETVYDDLDQAWQQLPQQLNDASLAPSSKAQIVAALPEKIDALEAASLRLKSRLNCP